MVVWCVVRACERVRRAYARQLAADNFPAHLPMAGKQLSDFQSTIRKTEIALGATTYFINFPYKYFSSTNWEHARARGPDEYELSSISIRGTTISFDVFVS